MKNFAALTLSAVLGFNAQQLFQADTITAKKFTLIDDKGNPRGGMTAADGAASIMVMAAKDKGGATAALTSAVTGDVGVVLSDSSGKIRCGMTLETDGTVSFSLNDPTGKFRQAGIGMTKDGKVETKLERIDAEGFALFDAKRNLCGLMSVNNGSATFSLNAPAQEKRAFTLAALNNGEMGFLISDGNGVPRYGFALGTNGEVGIEIRDKNNSVRAKTTVSADGKVEMTP